MSIHDLKALWAWCEQERNNEKFWRRFIAATATYEPDVQARLVKFAYELWFYGKKP